MSGNFLLKQGVALFLNAILFITIEAACNEKLSYYFINGFYFIIAI